MKKKTKILRYSTEIISTLLFLTSGDDTDHNDQKICINIESIGRSASQRGFQQSQNCSSSQVSGIKKDVG